LTRAKNPEQEDNPALDLDDPLREKDGWSAAYAYDANGNLEKRIDARGVETTYRYDDLNRVIEVKYSDGQTPRVERFYDGAVNGKAKPWYALTYAAGGNTPLVKTTIDSYDAAGRLTALRRQFYQAGGWKDFGVKQGYNHVGAATVKEYPSGRGLDYTYDLQGRVSSVKGTLGDGSYRIYADEIRYTAAGQLAHERFGTVTPLYHNRHYNNRLQPYDIRLGTQETDPWTWNRGALQLCYASNYAYGDGGADNNGNPYRIGHFVPLNESASDWAMAVMYYGYDPLNRIAGTAEARISAVDPVERLVYSQYYQYDPYGNRTIDPEKTTQHERINRQLFSVDTATNRFKELSYDAAGNVTRDSLTGAGERIYDGENRMISAYGKGGWSSYAYDADGRRVKRSANGQEWWLIYGIGGELLSEYNAGAEPKQPFKEYAHRGQELLVAAEAKKVKWHVADHLGTPRMIADATGSLAGMERHDYLPFGEEVPAGLGIREQKSGYGLDSSRQKFTGKERDDETSLDWFGPGRYYGALQGRFASTDPLNLPSLMRQDPRKFEAVIADPANWNGYVYAHNNPLSKQDPDGFLTIIIPGTWNDFNAWNTSAFKNWVKKSFGEDAVVWFWSGGDNNGARSEAAKRLSDFINQYMQHHPGEKLNIVAHSHGGNVAFEATHKLNYKIDTLVTLGTPIRGDYTPNRSNIGRHFNVFSDLDPVQLSGGRLPYIIQMGGLGSLYGQFGPAGRRVSGPGVKNIDAWQYAGGLGEAHSNLWQNPDVWNKLVEPALKK
jgi:RHS repeat-associated protein